MSDNEKFDGQEESKNVTHLLWTGGWDSTFRLLQLLFLEKKIVQPHYLIRPQECAGKEIDTIHEIRRKISRNHPEARKLMLPIEFSDRTKLKPNEEIKSANQEIAESKFISIQYEIFARYCEQNGISNMEIGVEKDSHSHHIIKDYLVETEPSIFRVDKNKSPESFYKIFKYIVFPLLKYNKVDMEIISRERNWIELMKMTWFCRRPKKGRPCGFCGPCSDVVIDGMAWRLPLKSRIIAYLQLPFRKWWRRNYQKQSEGIFKHIKYLLRNKT